MADRSESSARLRVGGIVLCGGRSRRMGQAKEWLPFGPEVLLQRMVRLAAQVVAPVVVAARPQQHLPPLPVQVRVVYDSVRGCGPLAGLAAGFQALADRCDAAFVTTCDHPLLEPAFITALIARLDGHRAVIPTHRGRTFPLTAVYRIDTQSLLAEGLCLPDRSVRAFAERCQAAIVSSLAFREVDPDLASFCNLNDAATYEATLRACGY